MVKIHLDLFPWKQAFHGTLAACYKLPDFLLLCRQNDAIVNTTVLVRHRVSPFG
jgi:hypothetical protein